MKIVPETCPTCGDDVVAVIESVQCLTYVYREEDGTFDWDSAMASEVFWDTSEVIEDDDGCVRVQCASKHEWSAKLLLRFAQVPTSGEIAVENMRHNLHYAPYCLKCTGLVRMRRVSDTKAECACGAVHELPESE